MNGRIFKYYPAAILLFNCLCCPMHAQIITLGSLLDEMVDGERLTRLPTPSYRLLHASSYDRRAIQPHTAAWFSNSDFGLNTSNNYVRIETIDGRTEYVLMEADGPGAIIRFWTTVNYAGAKTLRIYLDHSTVPIIKGTLTQLIGRNGLVKGPLSFLSSMGNWDGDTGTGHNLYLPIPFAQHCKITLEHSSGNYQVYYNIDYRIYDPPASVETFTSSSLALYSAQYVSTLSALSNNHPRVVNAPITNRWSGRLKRDSGTQEIDFSGPAAIRYIKLQLSATDLMQALRSTHLEMDFDGETNAVHCPLGDFFGTGGSATTGCTWFVEFKTNNMMHAFWMMPFKQTATLRLVNHGRQPVDIVQAEILSGPYAWQTNSMHFHAIWREYLFEDSTSNSLTWVGEDLNYITLEGTGRLMGDSLSIFNDAGTDIPQSWENWWGEGDEKIYVDGETFPSHFGTGTEDYYGYAWCMPAAFNTPFIAQPIGGGNSQAGKTINTRLRLLDDLPYRSSLVFDMELLPWRAGRHRFAPTVFWYALPGGTCHTPDPLAASQLPVAQTTSGIELATNTCPIALRLEFDHMTITQNTGGAVSIVTTNGWGLSQEKCLFWKSCPLGASLTFELQAAFTGECALAIKMISLPKSGALSVWLNDLPLNNNIALTGDAGHPFTLYMGRHIVNKGVNQLRVEVAGLATEHSSADFVFDYLGNEGPYDVSRLWPWTEVGTLIFLGQ